MTGIHSATGVSVRLLGLLVGLVLLPPALAAQTLPPPGTSPQEIQRQVEAMGLGLNPKDDYWLPSLNAVRVPAGAGCRHAGMDDGRGGLAGFDELVQRREQDEVDVAGLARKGPA